MPAQSPQRTCIACREAKDKSSLIRFVADPDNRLIPDISEKLPGRGVYVCRKSECIIRAVERKLFSRALKHELIVSDKEELLLQLTCLYSSRILNLLSLANRSGVIISGSDSVEKALKSEKNRFFLLVSDDTSTDRVDKFRYAAAESGIMMFVLFGSSEFGSAIGKESRNIILLLRNGITEKIHREIESLMKLKHGGTQAL